MSLQDISKNGVQIASIKTEQDDRPPSHLIEDSLVRTDEAPLEHLLLTIRVLDRVADVEDLAVVGYIRIVTILLPLTAELIHYLLPEKIREDSNVHCSEY
jgi:hypothetical protein